MLRQFRVLLILPLLAVAACGHSQSPQYYAQPAVPMQVTYSGNGGQQVQPMQQQVQVVQPQRECPVGGGTIIGAGGGAYLGNQLGGGVGKIFFTAAGALIGGLTGNTFDCRTVYPTTQYQQPPWRCNETWDSYSGKNSYCYRDTYRDSPPSLFGSLFH